jgi:hypothetical protein
MVKWKFVVLNNIKNTTYQNIRFSFNLNPVTFCLFVGLLFANHVYGHRDFLKGERILAVLPFEIRRAPNDPIVKLRVGDVNITGVFYTGQYDMIQLNPEDEKKLLES